jgi:hypothetical protein
MGRDGSQISLHLRMGLTRVNGNCADLVILVVKGDFEQDAGNDTCMCS